jgi:hypothetical protein
MFASALPTMFEPISVRPGALITQHSPFSGATGWVVKEPHRFSGDPSRAFPPRPRPNWSILPLTARPMPPPGSTRRRLWRLHDFQAGAGLRRPLFTLYERRRPCKTRFRLAGSAFAVRAPNSVGRFERFQIIRIPFPSLSGRKLGACSPQLLSFARK